ncbi:hypothetical protein TTHERM_00557800 (macronuclear) [Tetrahymena thermophila SB210]|uniref:PH domain-containing protein n=1 Tax=Tetrahymena thermophila (strain SB210) TaxID=312017 RepID=I7LWL2_TETTS|nr:hypothetical protein TTHERM_00557800 [Tetrahymena thermophila SB210]EAS02099.2 hypothetical protein TTHERM_00557800 [Tetrahymena thermophila SB210]|eukprot:XP_001022344.2 hypothetical protein TTHERM_00557800 [Tetrahymena thermophila SB210]
MATINSIKSNDNVMDSIAIYIENKNQKPMIIKTYDYKTCAEIKQLLIQKLNEKQQGLIQYEESQFSTSYASYNLVVQINTKKHPEQVQSRKVNPLERPFEIKYFLQNSKLEFYFIFEDSSNSEEQYACMDTNSKTYNLYEKCKYLYLIYQTIQSSIFLEKYIRMGNLGKLKKNESFSEFQLYLYPDHILYSQVKNKNQSVKIISLAKAHVQQLASQRYKNCFQIIESKIFTFRANSKLDLQGWLIEIFKCISNLQDKKLLDQCEEEIETAERQSQNYLVQAMDKSNMRCYKCIKKKSYRDKFIEFLMKEQEKYFINQIKISEKYQVYQNIIKMIDFIAKTQFNFPPYDNVQSNRNTSSHSSPGSGNNLENSFQGSYTQRKHAQSQDCTKLLKDFFENQIANNQYFQNFVFKILGKMHRLQYSKIASQLVDKQDNIFPSQTQTEQFKQRESTNSQQPKSTRISVLSEQAAQNNTQKENSPIFQMNSGFSTPASNKSKTNNQQQTENNNNYFSENIAFKELQTKNPALYEYLKKKQIENGNLSHSDSPKKNIIQNEQDQTNQDSQNQLEAPPQFQQCQSLIQFSSQQQSLQQQQFPSQSLIQFSHSNQPSISQKDQILPQDMNFQHIIQSRKTTNQSTTSSTFYSNNNQNLNDEILKYFQEQNQQKFLSDPSRQTLNLEDMTIESEPKTIREISDSQYFQNAMNNSSTNLIQIELSQQDFNQQIQQFSSEQMLNLLLGFIEIEAFTAFVKNGQYYKQIIKSRQQIYQQMMPNFDFLPKILNSQSNRFPQDIFTNQFNSPMKNSYTSGIAKVASKK